MCDDAETAEKPSMSNLIKFDGLDDVSNGKITYVFSEAVDDDRSQCNVEVVINLSDPQVRHALTAFGWKHVDTLVDLGWTSPPRAVLSAMTVRILLREGLDTVAKVLKELPRLQRNPGVGPVRHENVERWCNDRPLDSDLQLAELTSGLFYTGVDR